MTRSAIAKPKPLVGVVLACLLMGAVGLALAGCASVPPRTWPEASSHYIYQADDPEELLWPAGATEPPGVAAFGEWLRSMGPRFSLANTYAPRQLIVRFGELTPHGQYVAGADGPGRLYGVVSWEAGEPPTVYLFPGASVLEIASPTNFAMMYEPLGGPHRWHLWNIERPGSLGPTTDGPGAIYSDMRPWIAVTRDGVRVTTVDGVLRAHRDDGQPIATPAALRAAKVTSVSPVLNATHVAIEVSDAREPRGPCVLVWNPEASEAVLVEGLLGATVGGPSLDLLMAAPNTTVRLSLDDRGRLRWRKVLSVPAYPHPGSIAPDGSRMVSMRPDAFGKTYVHAVHAISEDGSTIVSTDPEQIDVGYNGVWLPHDLSAPPRVVVVPPPSGGAAGPP